MSSRNQPIDSLCKLINWFLYDKDIRKERVKDFNRAVFPTKFLSLIPPVKQILSNVHGSI